MSIEAPVGRQYEIGGRPVWAYRSGEGVPSVVFLPGGGAVGLDYWHLQQSAAELTTSVVYDRTGTGWSRREARPLSSAETVDELRELLRAMEIPAPYVLVGHSLGGLFARHYASRFPAEVAGLLLIETAHEDYAAAMPAELEELRGAFDPDQALPDELPEKALRFYRDLFGRMMAGWPAEIREPLVTRHVSMTWLRDGFAPVKYLDDYLGEIRQAPPLPDVPVILLTATGIDDFKRAVLVGESESLLQKEIEAKKQLYADFAASLPRGEHRLVDGVGHASIAFAGEDAILRAIRDLVARAAG